MFKKEILMLLVLVLFSCAANAQSRTEVSKLDAWELGANLGLAAFANAVNLTPAEINESFNNAKKNADKFGIKLPPLPAKTTVQKEYTRRFIDYFVEEAGHPTQKYLKANFSEEHAAAFDIGLATNIYFFLQTFGDAELAERYSPLFLIMIEDRTTVSNLPIQTTEEIVKLYDKKPTKEMVKKAVFNTITNVSLYFMKRDETEVGDRLVAQERYSEAIVLYTKIIEDDPNFAEAYFKRGVAYQKIGKEDLAKFDFEKAESLEPGIVRKLNAKKEND